MSLRDLLAEALASIRSQWVPAVCAALLALAMVLVTVLTVGRTAAAEATVQERLESAGSRTLIVQDGSAHENLTTPIVAGIAALSVVQTSFATSFPEDATPSALSGAAPAPIWWFQGNPADVASLIAGRWPQPGEAMISEQMAAGFGFEDPVGALTTIYGGEELPVVGIYRASGAWSDYAAGALAPAADGTVMRVVTAIGTSAAVVPSMQSQILSLISAQDPQDLRIVSPASLADIQAQVGADLTQFSRSLLYLILIAGAVLTAIVVLADVLVRQKDLGRRRALGATRADLVSLVLLRTVIPAGCGAIFGVVITAILTTTAELRTPITFAPAVAILATLTAAVATVSPALLGAYRDPVLVLRTP